MFCPNCNKFVEDNRENCPFCNTQIHNISVVRTPERRAMEKIVGSKLFLVMLISFTLYLVFLAMSVLFSFNLFSVLLAVFGAILDWRLWTLYLGTVKKEPESPKAENMTPFFTCYKVLCIILAVLMALASLSMVLVMPAINFVGEKIDNLSKISSDITIYDIVYEFTGDKEVADQLYDDFMVQSDLTEEEFRDAVEIIMSSITKNNFVANYIYKQGLGSFFKLIMIILTVFLVLMTAVCILLAVYMSKAVKFVTDFSVTWNGYAPWHRGMGYASGLGYFLSVVLFIVALINISSIPSDISFLVYLCGSVALFCFSKFTVTIQRTMDELYRLDLNV